MSEGILIRDAAANDLEEILDYLSERSSAAGDRFLGAIEKTFEFLVRFPLAGRLKEYQHPALHGMRMRPTKGFRKFLIFYLPTDKGIEIVRVLHGSRDIKALFEKDPE